MAPKWRFSPNLIQIVPDHNRYKPCGNNRLQMLLDFSPDSSVNLTISGLPRGVQATVQGQGNKRKVVFKASPSAGTGFAPVTVTGTSGSITQILNLTLAVSAAVGKTGIGTPVDLSAEFSRNGIYQDGSTYLTGGLDGIGYSYSANLLTGSRVFSGVLVDLGPANLVDAIACSGQSVFLPPGKFSSLMLLATAVQGNQTSVPLTVHYTDGTSSQFVQGFSDWFTPQKYPREFEGVAMAYRNFDDGSKDRRTFSLYAYQFALNRKKVVQSIGLPNNSQVVVLGATLLR
jgi:hypothetical protein